MLDAHPEIFGLGEDSVFNSGLAGMRDRLVEAFADASDATASAKKVLRQYADEVNSKMIEQSLLNARNVTPVPAPKRIVDKMLFNYRNIGFIHLTYPKAIILHTVRDPMDTLWSCYRHKFDDRGLDWSLDPERLVSQYVIYVKLMDHFRKILPGRIIEVSYEALVSDPEAVMRPLMKKVGLEWSDDIMKFHQTNRTVQTHSAGQVRHGISRAAVGIWRNYKKELKPIIDLLKPHLKALKYDKGLPFPDFINWDLDPEFDYDAQSRVSIPDLVAGKKIKIVASKKEVGKEEESAAVKPPKNKKRSKKSKSKKRKSSKKTGKKRKLSSARQSDSKESRSNYRKEREVIDSKAPKKVSDAKAKASSAPVKRTDKLNELFKKWQALYISSRQSSGSSFDIAQIRRQLPLPSGDNQIDDVISLAYALYLSRRPSDAAKLLQDLEGEIAPKEFPGIYLGIVQALTAADKNIEAIKYADRLIRVYPEYEDVYGAKAQLLASAGRLDEALDFLNYHIKQNKVDRDLLLIQRGTVYFKMQKFRSAHKDFSSVRRKDKEAHVMAMIGKCEKEFGETSAAVKSLKRALELDSSKADTHLDLGTSRLCTLHDVFCFSSVLIRRFLCSDRSYGSWSNRRSSKVLR
jgi:tetratricopeptide (TPR) repeat protein